MVNNTDPAESGYTAGLNASRQPGQFGAQITSRAASLRADADQTAKEIAEFKASRQSSEAKLTAEEIIASKIANTIKCAGHEKIYVNRVAAGDEGVLVQLNGPFSKIADHDKRDLATKLSETITAFTRQKYDPRIRLNGDNGLQIDFAKQKAQGLER